jgi:hypothetical protein
MHTLKRGVLQVLSGGLPAERESDRQAKRDLLALFLRTYRKLGDADDAELYIESLAYALADYPVDVVRTVLHPNGSLRRQHRYVPDYSELAKALATETEWRERQRERDERIRAQLDEREQRDRELARKPEQTPSAFAAEMRDRGLPFAPPRERGRLVGAAEVDWNAGIDGRSLVQQHDRTGMASDGKHGQRIAADLALRRARNQARDSELAALLARSSVNAADPGNGGGPEHD